MQRMKTTDKMQFCATTIILSVFAVVMMASVSGNRSEATISAQGITESEAAVLEAPNTEPTTEPETTAPEETKVPYVYYDIPLDDGMQEYIQDVCRDYGFDRYDIVVALIEKESTYRETVISSTDDYGYMQINKINHEWLSEEFGITDFLDGKQNILAGVHILSSLYEKYGDVELALMAYNCGERGAKELWMQDIFRTKYTQAVIEAAENLQAR